MGWVVKKVAADTNGITAGIIGLVDYHGGKASRINTMGIYDEVTQRWRESGATKGVSDVLVCYKGRFIGVEVKRGTDEQRKAQRIWQKDIEKAGGIYIIAKTYEEFKKWWLYYITTV